MISRQLITFIVLLLCTTSHSLKGVRGRSRQLQEADIFDKTEKDAPKDLEEDDTPKEDGSKGVKKDDKKSDKKDEGDKKSEKKNDKKKEDKKDKKNKKCKKRSKTAKESAPKEPSEDDPAPKMPKELSDEEDPTTEAKILDDKLSGSPVSKDADEFAPPDEESDWPWCEDASIKKSGDCQALRDGNFPNSSGVVTGFLSLEITSKQDNVVEAMERKLKEETSLTAVGCGGRRLESVTDGNVTEVFLLAVDISGLSASTSNCTTFNSTDDTPCTVMSSDVVIHYSGEATADQKIALFDSLTNTILTQAEGGDFGGIASVHYAEAKIANDEEENGGFSSPNTSETGSAGIIGGVLAAVVAAIAVAGVVVYKRKRSANEGCEPATVQPSDRQVIHVLSDDVEIVNAVVF